MPVRRLWFKPDQSWNPGQKPTSNDPGPLPGLDLGEPALKVAGDEHVHRQAGDAVQDDPILLVVLLAPVLVLMVEILGLVDAGLRPEVGHAAHVLQRHLIQPLCWFPSPDSALSEEP